MLRNIAIVFTGGAIGGFVTTLVATLIPATGIVEATGSKAAIPMHPMWILSPPDNYRLMVWGGLFGLFFLVPTVKNWNWVTWIIIVAVLAGPYALVTLFWAQSEGTMLAAMPGPWIGVLLYLALLVVLPIWRHTQWWVYGLIIGVVAGSSSLFIMFPIAFGGEMFAGMPLGPGTIPWVIFFNLFYGVSAAYFVMRAKLLT
jgi:hypothetical protein